MPSSSSPALLLVLCALSAFQLQVANTAVLSTVITPHEEFLCIPATFPDGHVCKTLFPNLTSIMAPNPKLINEERSGSVSFRSSPEHFNATLLEFNDFYDLLTGKDQCSNKIATLLCFSYFPSCNEVNMNSKKVKFTAFPCRSLCQEVTALESECTRMVGTWGPIFSGCNYTYGEDDNGHTRHVYSEENCVNETHLSYYDITHPEVVKPESCKTLDSKTDLTNSCNSDCKYRNKATAKTFDRNRNYSFAINCTVNSILRQGPFGKDVINCTVNKQFRVKANGSCTEAPELQENTNILILGHNSTCTENCLATKVVKLGTYIIAGTHVTRDDCGDTLWFANRNSLIELTSTKLEKKFRNGEKDIVKKGNIKRGCPPKI